MYTVSYRSSSWYSSVITTSANCHTHNNKPYHPEFYLTPRSILYLPVTLQRVPRLRNISIRSVSHNGLFTMWIHSEYFKDVFIFNLMLNISEIFWTEWIFMWIPSSSRLVIVSCQWAVRRWEDSSRLYYRCVEMNNNQAQKQNLHFPCIAEDTCPTCEEFTSLFHIQYS